MIFASLFRGAKQGVPHPDRLWETARILREAAANLNSSAEAAEQLAIELSAGVTKANAPQVIAQVKAFTASMKNVSHAANSLQRL